LPPPSARPRRPRCVSSCQLERGGLAEVDGDGWRLTAVAERVYGRALWLMDEWLRELEEAA